MSRYIICEYGTCGDDADLILVYGCLNGHLNDALLCNPHYLKWSQSHPKSVCGKCLAKIEDHEISSTKNIQMNAAATVLRRPIQMAKTENRLRHLPSAWWGTP